MEARRINGLDIFRGMALFLMLIYHFIYDLNHFKLLTFDILDSAGLLFFRYTIISMFILSVGMSLLLAHQPKIHWKSVYKRIFQLGLASMAVSIATYIVFPDSWIYFGILHFVLLTSLMVLPLINFPKVTLLLAIIISIGSFSNALHMHDVFNLLQEPLGLPTPHSEDVIPLFPWLTPLLIGMLLVQYHWHEKIFNHPLFSLNFSINKLFKKMGQNSLLIYLIHQPIFFAGFELYFIFFSR